MTFAPRTWTTGEVVTAAMMNTEVRDQFNSFFGGWSVYTPGWFVETGSVPTLGNGSLTGRYLKTGRTVDWIVQLTWGSTTAAGSGGGSENWMFGLPATPAAGVTQRIVACAAYDASSGLIYSGVGAYSQTNGGVVRSITSDRADLAGIWDSTLPFVYAATDVFYASGRYEAAS